MAGEIFVDTSAWYPLAVRPDPAHGPLVKPLRERIHQGAALITDALTLDRHFAIAGFRMQP